MEGDMLDPSKMKVADLRKELQRRGLSAAGLKPFLVKRLKAALLSDVNEEEEGVDEVEKEEVPVSAPATAEEEEKEVVEKEDTERGSSLKRRRKDDAGDEEEEQAGQQVSEGQGEADTNNVEEFASELQRLTLEVNSMHKEKSRLQYLLEEAKERQEAARAEGKSEAEQEFYRERADGRQALNLAKKKQEELEFKLCQKEEELQNMAKSKPNEQQDYEHQRMIRDEVKKREIVQFEKEQLKDQLEQYKQQNKGLQHQVEAMRAAGEREKKERDRLILEEKAKTEQLRLRIEGERDKMVDEWRKEYAEEMAAQKDALNKRAKEMGAVKRDLKQQLASLDDKLAERVKAEVQRLTELETELRKQEVAQEEMEAALAARQQTIELNEAYIEEEDARLKSDMNDLEARRAGLDKEKEELDERLYFVDMDAKKTQERFNDLDLKMIKLNTENSTLRDENEALQQQIRAHKSRASMIPLPSRPAERKPMSPKKSGSPLKKNGSPMKRSAAPVLSSKENTGVMVSNRQPPLRLDTAQLVDTKPEASLTERARSARRSMIPIRRGTSLHMK